MKKLILSELLLLFLATTFMTDSLPPGWYQQTLPVNKTINDIFFLDSLTGWVCTAGASSGSDTGYVMKTTNGGNNWIIQYNSIMNFNAVQFLNPNTGYAGGGDGLAKLYKTANGGTNWNIISSFGFITIKDLSFTNKDTGWICDDNPFNGGIYKTINGGTNWFQQAGSSYRPQKLFFINRDTGWAGSSDWKLYRTTNGGVNWDLQYTFTGAPNVFFPTKDTGYTGLFKTTNGGFNWFAMNNGQGGSGIFFLNSLTGYSCAGFSVMQKTVDGQNWFNQTVPVGGWVSTQFIDTSKGWAGGSILIHTTDGGGPPAGIIKIGNEIPNDFKLYQNYPNPFNPNTNIKYQIVKSSYVILKVFDIQGKEISSLVNQRQQAGTYEADFDGIGHSSGVYFYSLFVDGKLIDTKRMILLK